MNLGPRDNRVEMPSLRAVLCPKPQPPDGRPAQSWLYWQAALLALESFLPQAQVLVTRSGVPVTPLPCGQSHWELVVSEGLYLAGPERAATAGRGQYRAVPLGLGDPLAEELFCWLAAPGLRLACLWHPQTGFTLVTHPPQVMAAWVVLRARLIGHDPVAITTLDTALAQDDTWITAGRGDAYLQAFLQCLPTVAGTGRPADTPAPALGLVQALAHEVYTSLSTIQTWVHLLRKQTPRLSKTATSALNAIDQESRLPMDRLGLVLKVLEERSHPDLVRQPLPLALLAHHVDQGWQQQAYRSGIQLQVTWPAEPLVLDTDPALLNPLLLGLMEILIRNLPPGSQVQSEARAVGCQLKLQIHTCSVQPRPLRQPWGNLEIVPETGHIGLSLASCKGLVALLGGKLVTDQGPAGRDVIRVFLPLYPDLGSPS